MKKSDDSAVMGEGGEDLLASPLGGWEDPVKSVILGETKPPTPPWLRQERQSALDQQQQKQRIDSATQTLRGVLVDPAIRSDPAVLDELRLYGFVRASAGTEGTTQQQH